MTDTRSPLAERLLPRRGLFRSSAAPSRRGTRQRVALHLAALPLLMPRAGADIGDFAIAVALTGLLFLSLWLLSEGLRAEDDYRARSTARAPRLPLKALAAGTMGLGIGLCFLASGSSGFDSGLAAILGAGLHVVAFGFDPRRDKAAGPVSANDADRVDNLAETAQDTLRRIAAALAASRDTDAAAAGQHLSQIARDCLEALASHPSILPEVRRPIAAWLPALAEAAERFAPLQSAAPDARRADELSAVMRRVADRFADLAAEARAAGDGALSRDLSVMRETIGMR